LGPFLIFSPANGQIDQQVHKTSSLPSLNFFRANTTILLYEKVKYEKSEISLKQKQPRLTLKNKLKKTIMPVSFDRNVF